MIAGLKRPSAMALAICAAMASVSGAALAEVTEVRITRQPGLVYMPMVIVEQQGLIEKHAQELGLTELSTNWVNLTAGSIANEALLSRNVDLAMTGTTSLLLINDRTRGQMKGMFGVGGTPMKLVTRNENVQSVADFTASDRIAVPSVKLSTQAVLLQMAVEQEFGEDETERLDANTIQLGHTDAMIALSNPSGEVNSHFSLPPFQQRALQMDGVHEVLDSYELTGQHLSNAIIYGLESFYEENPTVVRAIYEALNEANAFIENEPLEAAKIYIDVTNEPLEPEQLVEIMQEPGTFFSTTPQGVLLQANHFYKVGVINSEPQDWKDYFVDLVHDLDGN